MVLINPEVLVWLIQASKACPLDVPRREEKLYDLYSSYEPESSNEISVYVAILEKIKESKLNQEDDATKKKIVLQLIKRTNKKRKFFHSNLFILYVYIYIYI